MQKWISLKNPEYLHIIDSMGYNYFGGTQMWYKDEWHKKAGCGPTTCSNLISYLSQLDNKYAPLVAQNVKHKDGFIELMNSIWDYVTPGKLGVNSNELFVNGAIRFGKDHGIKLSCESIKIPNRLNIRPTENEVTDFLTKSLMNNLPIAFLNLSNGQLNKLESWHWVTIIAFSPDNMNVIIYDNGRKYNINIGLWLKTTALGGGFITIV